MPVEVVPQWNQRSRFGGIVGKVLQVNTLGRVPLRGVNPETRMP